MKGLKFLVLVALLFVVTGSSYGQCAWILWDRQRNDSLEIPGGESNESWELIGAYPSYELCLKARSKTCETQVELWRRVSANANMESGKKRPTNKKQPSPFKDPSPIMGVTVFGTDDQCTGYWVYDLGYLEKKQHNHSFECFPETFDPRK
jgi:hypothetical protein